MTINRAGRENRLKAIVLSAFGNADQFVAADLPIPEVREGEVRIRIQAVSFNPVDYQIRQGRSESRFLRSMILGRDLSGVVDAVHENVTGWRVGDEVCLSACCALLAVDGGLASITDAPSPDDFDLLFLKNASFHSVGANAYSLSEDRAAWRRYGDLLAHLCQLFDSGALAPPPITLLGRLSPEVVKEAHRRLESNAVQGKLVMSC